MEVGADLCEIDTEAEATVEASESSSSPAEAAPATEAPIAAATAAPPTPAPAKAAPVSPGARTPSIHFLGKDGWARVLSGGSSAVQQIPANYGRLTFSEEEMEALITGGASLAPDVKEYSSGGSFVF